MSFGRAKPIWLAPGPNPPGNVCIEDDFLIFSAYFAGGQHHDFDIIPQFSAGFSLRIINFSRAFMPGPCDSHHSFETDKYE